MDFSRSELDAHYKSPKYWAASQGYSMMLWPREQSISPFDYRPGSIDTKRLPGRRTATTVDAKSFGSELLPKGEISGR